MLNLVQIAQLEQQHTLLTQQNAQIADQNQSLADEEVEQQQIRSLTEREAIWKQFMLEVNQSFDEIEDLEDEVSLLAQAEYFLRKCDEWKFDETDLTDIGDKQYFVWIRRRANSIWEQASKKSHTNYEKFKALYSEYSVNYAGRCRFPEAESADFQEKRLLTSFNRPKPELTSLSDKDLSLLVKPPKELNDLRRKADLYGWGIVATLACNLCLPGIALIPAGCIYFFCLMPLKSARQPLEEQFQKDLEQAKQERIAQQEAKLQRSVDQWERERRDFDARLPEANRKIKEHNHTLKNRIDIAQAKWLNRKRKMFTAISNYIDRHPSLQTWFPIPEAVDAHQQNSD